MTQPVAILNSDALDNALLGLIRDHGSPSIEELVEISRPFVEVRFEENAGKCAEGASEKCPGFVAAQFARSKAD